MLEAPLRYLSILMSVLVVLGFGLFAIDETRSASKSTADEVASRAASDAGNPQPTGETAREASSSSVREVIDDANDVLLSPFEPLSDGMGSEWARRGIPALLALLAYGFGLSMLARYARGA